MPETLPDVFSVLQLFTVSQLIMESLSTMEIFTTLCSDGLTPCLNAFSIREMNRRGIYFALASGRSVEQLHALDFNDTLRKNMEGKGISYVQQSYNWDLIMQRLIQQIEYICNK